MCQDHEGQRKIWGEYSRMKDTWKEKASHDSELDPFTVKYIFRTFGKTKVGFED